MSETTPVINKHHGVKYDVTPVYIGRGSLWGNPYPISKTATRYEVIKAFEEYLLTSEELLEELKNLYGKTLLCFCSPAPCHGDILAYYADSFYETGELPEIRGIVKLYPEGNPDKPKKTLFNF